MTTTMDTTAVAGVADHDGAAAARHRSAPRPRDHWGAAVALVVGAALRGGWLAYARPEPVSDFRHYLRLAYGLLDTGTFGVGHPSAWRLPAYPVVLAAGAAIDRNTLVLSGLTVALSIAQIGLTYWVAWRMFGRRSAATAAALTAAAAPAFVTFAPVLASEHLLAVLMLAAVGVALGCHTGRWQTAAAVGGLAGAAVLTRGEALAYLPVVAAVVALERRVGGCGLRRSLVGAGITVAVALAVVVPWVVRNEQVVGTGAGLTTTGGFNFYLAHSPGAYGWRTPLPLPLRVTDEITRNNLGWRYGLQYARRHPEHWWPTVRTGTRELLAPSAYAARYATVHRDPDDGRLVARRDLGVRAAAVELAARSSRWLLWAGAAGLAVAGIAVARPAFSLWRSAGPVAVGGIAVANWVLYAVVFWAQARYRFVVDAFACVAVGAIPAVLRRRYGGISRP